MPRLKFNLELNFPDSLDGNINYLLLQVFKMKALLKTTFFGRELAIAELIVLVSFSSMWDLTFAVRRKKMVFRSNILLQILHCGMLKVTHSNIMLEFILLHCLTRQENELPEVLFRIQIENFAAIFCSCSGLRSPGRSCSTYL